MPDRDRRNLFRNGEMALVLLAILRHKRMSGYELLAELERVLPGYRASPGSVYPALTALVEEGLLDAIDDDRHARRRLFTVTTTGRRALEQRASGLAAFEVRTGARISSRDAVEATLDRFRLRLLAVAERLEPQRISDALDKTAHELESAAREGGTRNHG